MCCHSECVCVVSVIPLSNIAFLSKVIGRIGAQRLNSHMNVINMQSAYKKHHNTKNGFIIIYSKLLLNSIDP